MAEKIEWRGICAHGVNYDATEEQVRAFVKRKNAETGDDRCAECRPFVVQRRVVTASEWESIS